MRRVSELFGRITQRLSPKLASNQRGRPALDLAKQILGPAATNVIDVGARAAGMEKPWWRLEGLAGCFGFEPDPEECAKLNAALPSGVGARRYFPVALGKTREERVLYITRDPACSSLYEPDEAVISRYPELRVASQVREVSVPVVSLNEWWQENLRPDVSFIKLDTQGSELDILRGGADVLKACVGCEAEVEFNAIYKGQPLFHELDQFMREQGFTLWRLYGLCHYTEAPAGPWTRSQNVAYGGLNRSFPAGSGRLFWANAIYFRDYGSDLFREDPRRLLLLLALLEGCEDYDGVKAVVRRLVAEKIVPANVTRIVPPGQ